MNKATAQKRDAETLARTLQTEFSELQDSVSGQIFSLETRISALIDEYREIVYFLELPWWRRLMMRKEWLMDRPPR